jgi:hypothetical protein
MLEYLDIELLWQLASMHPLATRISEMLLGGLLCLILFTRRKLGIEAAVSPWACDNYPA